VIDLTGTTKFGNMTSGGGLATIFDDDTDTGGYRQSTSGWAGVTLNTPSVIDKAEFVSAENGFDASGSTTSVTLKLYGKVGDVPTTSTDGVLLGSKSFTDQNVMRAVSVESTDKTTEYDHVWGVVSTGVWSGIRELRLYEDTTPPPPSVTPYTLADTHPQTLQRSCDTTVNLTQSAVLVDAFTTSVQVPADGSFDLDYSINVVHRGNLLSPSYLGAVGIGATLVYRYSTTLETLESQDWLRLPISSTNGINIDERNPAHYANVSMSTGHPAEVGYYQFGIRMSGHTDGTTQNGVAAVLAESDGLNGFRIRYTPGGEFVNMNGVGA
jgi:hypothetical protein